MSAVHEPQGLNRLVTVTKELNIPQNGVKSEEERHLWLQMEARLKDDLRHYVDAQIVAMKTQIKQELADEMRAQAGSATQVQNSVRKSPVSTKGVCFVCGGTTAVHRHREFEVYLDDRCRKQVETV